MDAMRKVYLFMIAGMMIIIVVGMKTFSNSGMTWCSASQRYESTDYTDHHDKVPPSDSLRNVSVLCWIMTMEKNLKSKAVHVKKTWGKRCDKLMFMSDKDDKTFPAVGLNTPLGREHLTAKTMRAFQYLYEHHLNDSDWFMKADDDTYVIVENLKYFLSKYDPGKSFYFGRPFKTFGGYHSGGAGYVISKEALRMFGNRTKNACSSDSGFEDAEFGKCMKKLGIQLRDTKDKYGKSLFNAYNPVEIHHDTFPKGYKDQDQYGGPSGINSTSDLAITFHYVTPQDMYLMEHYVYHLRPYGRYDKTEPEKTVHKNVSLVS